MQKNVVMAGNAIYYIVVELAELSIAYEGVIKRTHSNTASMWQFLTKQAVFL